jgi:hypothetical protein
VVVGVSVGSGTGCFAPPDMVGSESGTTDAGTSDASTGATTGATTGELDACGNPNQNLLRDGSFENWVASSLVDWGVDAEAEQLSENVVHGEHAVRIVSSGYTELEQDVEQPFAAGSCFEVCVSLRYDGGHDTPPDIAVIGIAGETQDLQFETASWEPDRQWHRVQAGFVLDVPADYVVFAIVSNDADGQEKQFSVDGAILNALDGC